MLKGSHHSEESIERLRASHIGLQATPGFSGHKHTSETKARYSAVRAGNNNGHGNLGKPKSEEHRMRIGLANKGNSRPDMTGNKLGLGNKVWLGRAHTDETKNKIGEQVKITIITHHRDFDHSNDASENRIKMEPKRHAHIHRCAGKLGTIFMRGAVKQEMVSLEFYEEYLAYINQDKAFQFNLIPSPGIRVKTSANVCKWRAKEML